MDGVCKTLHLQHGMAMLLTKRPLSDVIMVPSWLSVLHSVPSETDDRLRKDSGIVTAFLNTQQT